MLKIDFLGIFMAIFLAGALAKTIIEDLDDYEREKEQNLTNISFEDYAKAQERDPCDPFVPLVPDVSKLETISESKCKEYIWLIKNREREAILCRRFYKSDHSSNSTHDNISSEFPIIYGGRDATVAQFSHMGAVGWRSKEPSKEWVFKCGSTLISDKFLLTAAHCSKISPRFVPDIVNSEPEVVMLGVENITDTTGTEKRRPKIEKIIRIIVHPDYKPPKKYNDIALLEVEKAITFTSFILPACIWPHNDIAPLEEMISLTGWGQTESGRTSPVLQVAEVEVLNTSLCDNLLKSFLNRNWNGFTDKQMCAGVLSGGIDTCQGDSGGPLQVNFRTNTDSQMYMVIGVTSFGIKCGVKNQPGVYTRVSSYTKWIEEIVWG